MRFWVLLIAMVCVPTLKAEIEDETLSDVTFLGLNLFEADISSVRKHLNDLGGFRQERKVFTP